MDSVTESENDVADSSQKELKTSSRKRRFSATDQEGFEDAQQSSSVKVKEDITNGASAPKYREIERLYDFNLINFSDEILYEIFKHLDSWTLLSLASSCQRFSNFILDNRFWRNIDLSREPLPLGILEDIMERTHVNTKTLMLRGPAPSQHLEPEIKQLTKTLCKTFTDRCTQLSVLELQGITIDFKLMRILDFPQTLKRLYLRDCSVRVLETGSTIFTGIDTHLTMLEELGIEYNDWFEPYYIMILSKLPSLRWLSLKGCPQMSEFVPYGSMGARFGFKALEYLDLRFTPINDSDLQCFNAVSTLKEILLDCPENLRYKEMNEILKAAHEEALKSEAAAAAEPVELIESDDEGPSTSSAKSKSKSNVVEKKEEQNIEQESATNSRSVSPIRPPPEATAYLSLFDTRNIIADTDASIGSSSAAATTSTNSTTTATVTTTSTSSNTNTSSTSAVTSSAALPSLLSLRSSNNNQASIPIPVIRSPPRRGNAPSYNRFIYRPDEIVYVEFPNRRPVVSRRSIIVNNNNNNNQNNNNNGNEIDQVLNHPLFWNILHPIPRWEEQLGRLGRDIALIDTDEADVASVRSIQRRSSILYRMQTRYRCPISDRGITCFGRPRNPVEQGIIWIRIANRQRENRFERMSIRNYRLITDITLDHLVQCSPYLIYLDLSNTSVTRSGIRRFKELKPDCEIVATHITEAVDDTDIENNN